MKPMENLPQKSDATKQLTSSTPKLKGIDKRVYEAKNSRLILDLNDYEFRLIVLQICTLVGCALPSPESTAQLHSFVSDNFMGTTDRGFRLAFEMNASGQLANKISHYNSFDASFIGDVLNGYKEAERKANREALKTVHTDHAAQLLEPPIEQSDFMRIHKTHIEQVKQGNLIPAQLFAPTMVEWLLKRGILKDNDIPDSMMNEWKSKAKRLVFDEYEITPTKWERIKEQPTNYERYKKYILIEVKRMVYIWYLQTQIKTK